MLEFMDGNFYQYFSFVSSSEQCLILNKRRLTLGQCVSARTLIDVDDALHTASSVANIGRIR